MFVSIRNLSIKNLVNIRHINYQKKNINDFHNLKENIFFEFKIKNMNIDNLKKEEINYMFKDGRIFSHFVEMWLDKNCTRLQRITGCKGHDFIDINNKNIKYQQKTWTDNGLVFLPSNMVGTQRNVNKKIFLKKNNKLKYVIVSNVFFPIIKVMFIDGKDLILKYPSGMTRKKDSDLFH